MFLDVQIAFRVAGARNSASREKWAKREGFIAFPKTLAGVRDLLSRVRKVAFCVAGAVTSHLGGWCLKLQMLNLWNCRQFWLLEILLLQVHFSWQVQHFVCLGCTFSWQAQFFWRMKRWNRKTQWYGGNSCGAKLSKVEEVSHNCCVFTSRMSIFVECLADLLRFHI